VHSRPLGAAYWLLRAREQAPSVVGKDDAMMATVLFLQLPQTPAVQQTVLQECTPKQSAQEVRWDDEDDTTVSHNPEFLWTALAEPACARLLCLQSACTDPTPQPAHQYALAQLYAAGQAGLPQSWLTAVMLSQLAAEQGYADAMVALGRCYQLGHGVRANPRTARTWWRRALPTPEAAAALASLPALLPGGTAATIPGLCPPMTAPSSPPPLWPAVTSPIWQSASMGKYYTCDLKTAAPSDPAAADWQPLQELLETTLHATSDTCTYVARALEPARLKALWEQPKAWLAFKSDWAAPPMHRGYINAVQAAQLTVVRNPAVWARYQTRKQALLERARAAPGSSSDTMLAGVQWYGAQDNGLPVLDARVGEVWLYHGTSRAHIDSILTDGFHPETFRRRETVRGFGPLGRGTYLTDNFAKAATYVNAMARAGASDVDDDSEAATESRHVLLCRVLLGRPLVCRAKNRTQDDNAPLMADGVYSSLYGPGADLPELAAEDGQPRVRPAAAASAFRCNEFCVPDGAHQIYPECIIEYRPTPARALTPPTLLTVVPAGTDAAAVALRVQVEQYQLDSAHGTLRQRIHGLELVHAAALRWTMAAADSDRTRQACCDW
jgi:hypothetical protein